MKPNLYALPFALLSLLGSAGANTATTVEDIGKNLTDPICSVHKVLTGPVGIGLIIIMIIFGGFAFVFGNRNAMGMVIGSLVGAAIVFFSGAILGIVVKNQQGGNCSKKATTASVSAPAPLAAVPSLYPQG